MPSVYSRKLLLISVLLTFSVVAVACSDGETPFATVEPTATTSAQQQVTPTSLPGNGGSGDAAKGESLFASNSCNSCHSTGSNSVVGPGLAGVSQRGDDAYLRQSIREPLAVIVEGFAPAMPPFPALTDADIGDLIAYLKTLQ